jgi:hypothetical protein
MDGRIASVDRRYQVLWLDAIEPFTGRFLPFTV